MTFDGFAFVGPIVAVLEALCAVSLGDDDPGDCRVYFIQAGDDGPVKIGYSLNVAKRVVSLQSGNPIPLKVLAVTPGGPDIEGLFHALFSHDRLNGEWFRWSDLLATWVDFLVYDLPDFRKVGSAE